MYLTLRFVYLLIFFVYFLIMNHLNKNNSFDAVLSFKVALRILIIILSLISVSLIITSTDNVVRSSSIPVCGFIKMCSEKHTFWRRFVTQT